MNWRIIIFIILTIFLAACSNAAPEPTIQYQTGVQLQAAYDISQLAEGVTPTHSQMEYLLYLPQGYGEEPDKEWPLIVFLHGSGYENNDSAWMMGSGLPEVLNQGDQPADFPFIVISPQALPGNTWWSGDIPVLINAVIDEVADLYQVDTDRIYLTGLSMGGYGTWFMATAYPEKFTAVASISGSGYRIAEFPPLETLCILKDVPLWAIHGAQDNISEPRISEIYADTLKESCNGDVKWTLYPDTGHLETFTRAYRDPALYDWFLSHPQ
ncbi:MAG: prolyl oligopeptidase family serine peptidase [Chloroflexi bacterium]|nr:prolyl oligopeptidase family serine peptidase [Chloroflexota bacterium]